MILNYCMECAAALTKQTETLYVCENGHFFYNSPVGASVVALINDTGEVLFSKRANDPEGGKYDLPGGFLLFGEDAESGARRELIEEAGIELGEVQLLTSIASTYRENYTTADHVFVCTDWQGTPVAADDAAALEWHPIEFAFDSDQIAFHEAFRPAYEMIKAYIETIHRNDG